MTSLAEAAQQRRLDADRANQWRRMGDPERSGERFRTVVLPHLPDALALARWLTGSRTDAEDVVQEACIRALAGIDGYDGRNARAWVLAIVRNTSFTWLAKHRPKSLVVVGDMAAIDELAQRHTDASAHRLTPEAELIRKADARAVEAAIGALPSSLFPSVLPVPCGRIYPFLVFPCAASYSLVSANAAAATLLARGDLFGPSGEAGWPVAVTDVVHDADPHPQIASGTRYRAWKHRLRAGC